MSPSQVIDAIWRQTEPHVFFTREQFERSLDGCVIEPFESDGQLAFVTVVHGPEFHFVSLGTGATISIKMIRDSVQPIIDRYGYVQTRTPKDDVRQRRINEKIGFTIEAEDEAWVLYRMTTPIWARRQSCQL